MQITRYWFYLLEDWLKCSQPDHETIQKRKSDVCHLYRSWGVDRAHNTSVTFVSFIKTVKRSITSYRIKVHDVELMNIKHLKYLYV